MAPYKQRHKKSKQTYTKQANFLRRHGFGVTFKGNAKNSRQQKSAVTRLYKKVSAYTESNRFKYYRASPKNHKKLRGAISSQQITPKGFFYQRPFGIDPKIFKVRFTEDGIRVEGGPNYSDEIIPLDPIKLAIDPIKAVESALEGKKPLFVRMVVNGNESPRDAKSLELFWGYFADLYSDLTSEDEEDRERGGRALTDDEIADIFHLKLIYK